MGTFDQQNQHVEHQQNADTINNYGVPFEQYKADLTEKEKEIRRLLKNAALVEKEKTELNQKLAKVEQLRLDERASYEAHKKDLEERLNRLDQLSGKIPEKLIEEAKLALAKGDTVKADQFFSQVEEQADPHIAAAAEATYQRGKLSEDAIQYHEAFQHYQRAILLTPGNPEYLSSAASMAYTLAQYSKAINWNEQALELYLEQDGEDSADVAGLRNNLGLAWQALGEYEKAIGYLEKALTSDLKTYGEDHPHVAIRRNNLGMAWHALGGYDKAIGYYEQALASDLKTYGEDHPEVATCRNNLGMAWDALGEHEKAIGYLEKALVTFRKVVSEDHPNTKQAIECLEYVKSER